MPNLKLPCLLLLISLPVANALADDAERTAVLTIVERAFAAISSGSIDDARAIQLADGISISFRQHPDGKAGELQMRMHTNDELLLSESGDGHDYMERWSGAPTVLIRGPIAVAWGSYEFWIDGQFSHCGIDSIDLVKVDGNWKIANWMWTVEKEGCAMDPSREQ
jgi:hypothetical protein